MHKSKSLYSVCECVCCHTSEDFNSRTICPIGYKFGLKGYLGQEVTNFQGHKVKGQGLIGDSLKTLFCQ